MTKLQPLYKYLFTLSLLAFCVANICAGEIFAPYSVKLEGVGGYIYPHDVNIVKPVAPNGGPSLGGQVAFEWHMDGHKQWHRDFNYPTVGVALQVIDLHNPKVLGQMIAPYTYINIPMVRSRVADFNFMFGGGLGFCTKPCDKEAAIATGKPIKEIAADYNFIIGGPLTFNLQAGVNVDFHVHKDVDITLGVDYNHFSSGSLFQPNSGLNIFDGKIGVKYHIQDKKHQIKEYVPDSTKMKRWYGEVIASGGAKTLYFKDTQYYGCASLNIGAYYRTCRQHRIGLGVDMFYDGAFTQTATLNQQTGKWEKYNGNTSYGKTFNTEDKFLNKFRVGLNITNEITIGKFMLGFGVGIYLYDPVKNMEPYNDAMQAANEGTSLKRGVFYAYNPDKQDGWNYFRLSCKYYITKHLLVNLGFKTHLQKVEFVEFGVGTWF